MQKIQFQLRNTKDRIIKCGQTINLSTCFTKEEFHNRYIEAKSLLPNKEWQLIDLSTNAEIITEFDEINIIWDLYQNTRIKTDAQLAYFQFKNDYNISESFNECYLGNNKSAEDFAKQYCIDRKIVHEDFPQCCINWWQFARKIEIGINLGKWKYYYIDDICYVFKYIS